MSSQRYSPEFKDEAVRQNIERGYSVAGISERLGVSSHGKGSARTAPLLVLSTLLNQLHPCAT